MGLYGTRLPFYVRQWDGTACWVAALPAELDQELLGMGRGVAWSFRWSVEARVEALLMGWACMLRMAFVWFFFFFCLSLMCGGPWLRGGRREL